jgi:hypothetical protein
VFAFDVPSRARSESESGIREASGDGGRCLERVVEHREVREAPALPGREDVFADRLDGADPQIGRGEDVFDAQLGQERSDPFGGVAGSSVMITRWIKA